MKSLPELALFAMILMAASTATAQQTPVAAAPAEAKRTILERHDQSGVDGKEIVLGSAELPPGATIGWHVHPGDESSYLIRGTTTLKVRGQPDRLLKAGDHFFIPRGTVHSVTSADGATAVSSWILDKGKPLAEPVK
ncbi:MAG: cupin domain-containing protein [Rudaea sp.]